MTSHGQTVSDPCSHNQHELCSDPGCPCGCHYIERNHGSTPEQFKGYMKKMWDFEVGLTEGGK